jgi:prophage DNA circulation protein
MSEALTSLASFSTALPFVGANLRPAALRGLLFYVEKSEDTAVRRWVTHEFPGRDEPWHEDLGAKTQSFSIEGLLIGADVVLQARAFERAAKDPEVATLLHPWLGGMQVIVQDCRISFDTKEARVARISLRVEKAGTKPAPVIEEDGLGSVLADAEELLTEAQAAYAQYRYMRAAADFVIESFKASVMGIAGAIESALSSLGQGDAAAGSVAALASMNDAAIVSDTAVPLALATAARDVSALAGGRAALTRGAAAAPVPAFEALGALTSKKLVPDANALVLGQPGNWQGFYHFAVIPAGSNATFIPLPFTQAQALNLIHRVGGAQVAVTLADNTFDPGNSTFVTFGPIFTSARFYEVAPATYFAQPTSTQATTPARQQLVTANEALGVLAAAMFAGEFARAAAAVPWASRDDAMAARDRVCDALAAAADLVAALGWNAVWQRLMALRASIAADLAQRAAPLPRIKRLELPGVMPATLIAYRLNGDSISDVFGRGAALAARNRVRHPGFVPAGNPIEVLA